MRMNSIFELEMRFKRAIYNLLNDAKGKTLIWDSKTRKYVAHIEPNMAQSHAMNHYGSDRP